jgi:hypothetical protein
MKQQKNKKINPETTRKRSNPVRISLRTHATTTVMNQEDKPPHPNQKKTFFALFLNYYKK